MLLLHDVQSLRDCDRAAKEDTPNLEDPPGPDARLPSSLNYNMHRIALYPMVRIASPLTLLMLALRHCGPATGGQYKEILVIHSSFLMRLLSHNPLSTPFDPPLLGDREREEELGDTPKPSPGSVLDLFRGWTPSDSRHLVGAGPCACPLCTPYVSRSRTACCAPTPAGPISSPSTGEDQGEGNGNCDCPPGLQPGGLLALFCHSRASP